MCPGNGYNVNVGGSSGDVGEKGKVDKKAPAFKDGENVNASVPKLPQVKGKE